MVKVIENHAEIAGTLLRITPAPDRPGYVSLSVMVDAAFPVGDWPNLFDHNVGECIEVLAREDSDVARSEQGQVRLHVKKAGPTTVFAE
jgi:hypothetical protein